MKNVIFTYDTIQNGERGEHLRGRSYVENSIKSVEVKEA